ncbi:hypothetical protein PFISCL1PPCAC_1336, partial [Pristionchus fissidentatus]
QKKIEEQFFELVGFYVNRLRIDEIELKLSSTVNLNWLSEIIITKLRPKKIDLVMESEFYPRDFLFKVAEVVDDMRIYLRNDSIFLSSGRDDWIEVAVQILSRRCSSLWMNNTIFAFEVDIDNLIGGIEKIERKINLRLQLPVACEYLNRHEQIGHLDVKIENH